ncbi:hypothetical protein TNCV_1002351 [Trichonephila clavipes]|nr:hypothetical protein TNCV_1002351 [Trichonephila clavipes]
MMNLLGTQGQGLQSKTYPKFEIRDFNFDEKELILTQLKRFRQKRKISLRDFQKHRSRTVTSSVNVEENYVESDTETKI